MIQIVIRTDGIITFCAYNITGVLGDFSPLTRFCLTPCVIRIWQNLSLGHFVKDVKELKELKEKGGGAYRKTKAERRTKKKFHGSIITIRRRADEN